MKKVIAAMTVGKDVSVLFPDVVKCMQTPNIELKKLVYLYLINYAKSQPESALPRGLWAGVRDRNTGTAWTVLAVRHFVCFGLEGPCSLVLYVVGGAREMWVGARTIVPLPGKRAIRIRRRKGLFRVTSCCTSA